MTILRVHENPTIKGGSEVYIRDVSEQLESRGIKNILLFITEEQPGYRIFVNREWISNIPKEDLTITLDDILKDYKIDLVHIHGLSIVKAIEYMLSRYKVVRTMHEPRMVCPGYGKFWVTDGKPCTVKYGFHCFYHAYTQKCFRSRMPFNVFKDYQRTEFEVKNAGKRYAAILTMSEYIRNEAIIGGIPEEKVICNPHFTKFELPYLAFEERERKFLFVGRLIEHKGIYQLLDAILPVLQQNADTALQIIGDGPLYNYVMDFVKGHQLQHQIVVEKWKSSAEISTLMKTSYCVLFPSIYPEAFGLVGIEAAMHSKPVIAFNTGGVSTWLKNNFNGFLLNEVSADALRGSIQKMIDNPEQYKQMSKNAWELASSYFSPKRHVEMLIDIYLKCLAT
ncbi:glycosyltransferase family 4 protein [Agriterribacter humi]|uniref:glycosyltransferase family 4 protein n=1 Tax=Agriterribacter humi TaxID=1104781 RepID=UPI0012644732|nr:glycosyltransferase family 4 protein [Agriterribacter humi]